jgi:hypothetical protein
MKVPVCGGELSLGSPRREWTLHDIATGQVCNGISDSTHSCSIAVNNASSLTASSTRILPITFASANG